MRIVLLALSASILASCSILFPCGAPGFGAAAPVAPERIAAGCITNEDCPSNFECRLPEQGRCFSSCRCTPSGMACTEDCSTSMCQPRREDAGVRDGGADAGSRDGGNLCANFEPPCSSNAQCGAGRACERHLGECNPSACGCDPRSGAIVCTTDCGGSRCTVITDAGTNGDAGSSDAGLCANFEPPCSSSMQCRPGTTCKSPATGCAPSACSCDPATGQVSCTTDCNGMRCLP